MRSWYNTWEQKRGEKQVRPSLIVLMNDVRWTQGGQGGWLFFLFYVNANWRTKTGWGQWRNYIKSRTFRQEETLIWTKNINRSRTQHNLIID